ncbi:MAG: thioredoxin-disulfide reductase [Clostridiales bacterium]|nr:thioredoxin-disulfide reductase [Clostridiales bacterium]MBR5358435.1 thioredoxin-disulfide reductase [Clostridiales bacterium]
MADIIIVGAGPAGLSAAIYARRAGMDTVVYEAESYGGQIINTPEIENYPAIAKISGFDFADGLYKQAEALGAKIKFDKVTQIKPAEGGFEVATEYSGTETCKAVVLAVGAKNRHMGIAREEELTGKGVSYCATCDGAFYKGKTVAVTGGGNTAVEDAIYLCGMAEKVYLVHRRNEFRAEETLVNAAKAIPNLEIVTPYVVKELKGEPKLTSVVLENREDGSEKELAVDGLFVAIGQEPATADFKDLITLSGGYIEAGEDCKTNVPGIFAAGDGRTKKVRQLTTACADGAVAALAAVDYIKLG